VRYLILLNDPPYGTERSYNGLRLALSLAKRDEAEIRVFLMGDAVGCAVAGQKTPNGYYNLERMIEALARKRVPSAVVARVSRRAGSRTTASSRARATRRSKS
jgi:uncharacterized protein involved in oxidation of intracellular sulfur